jgi:hypothetical protein
LKLKMKIGDVADLMSSAGEDLPVDNAFPRRGG